MEKVAFGGGCFWCTEAVFTMLKGVSKVLPGYAGGKAEDATYEKVSTGNTLHAEVIYLEYNPQEVKFRNLLTVFFASHDPSTLNRQGNDVGPQYRSVVFYSTEEQKNLTKEIIKEIDASNPEGNPVVTEVVPLEAFYEAENYHQDYYATHPDQAYCRVIINPKLEKIQKDFSALLKKVY